jgi:hypothetical protein
MPVAHQVAGIVDPIPATAALKAGSNWRSNRERLKLISMARDRRELDRLAAELAQLTADERAEVIADAMRRSHGRRTNGFEPPVLAGGTEWIGGSLSRAQLYGDDGR